uniref:ribulose-phosphate 3-epimerase n=1 Tax=Oncorhynchus tshawytscha TaxID=74940 RepID=A0A8C8CA52_ONCTS
MSYSAKMLVLVQLQTCIGTESVRMTECGADFLHLDSFCTQHVRHPMVECLRNCESLLSQTWSNQYTFHPEATTNAGNLIKEIFFNLNLIRQPGTTVEELAPWAGQINMALVMTVEPGFGGQKFMEDMMPKVSWLRSQFPSLDIVDGGVGPSAIHKCAEVSTCLLGSDEPRSVRQTELLNKMTFFFWGGQASVLSLPCFKMLVT